MIYPTIQDLTQGKINRYELAVATAKGARMITEEYIHQREAAEAAEKALAGSKEAEKPLSSMIDRELKDEKAVKIAINRIYSGEFVVEKGKQEANDDDSVDLNALTGAGVVADNDKED